MNRHMISNGFVDPRSANIDEDSTVTYSAACEDNSDFNLDFANALLAGLSTTQKSIPCRFLYDQRGSELFEQITELQEYYPTRTETSILRAISPVIARSCEDEVVLVELGSGSSVKTELLLEALGEKVAAYVAIEISQAALNSAIDRIQARFPNLSTVAICDDFIRGFTLPKHLQQHPLVGFFPGSTIGNLERTESVNLLASIRKSLGAEARLIVGTDLVKSPSLLVPAYDDSLGITAEFTRNILHHANRSVETNFNVHQFQHHVQWNERKQRIEIYLVSLCEQSVNVLGQTIHFHRRERIHIESSHKYTIDGFRALAKHAGWQAKDTWTDAQEWFAVHEFVAV